VSEGGPAGLLEQLRAAGLGGDVQLLGGPQTIQAFLELGALGRLELLLLPILVGEGLPFSPPGTPQRPLKLESERAFPDGVIELVYSLPQDE
jgi:dihydrofolate reductase